MDLKYDIYTIKNSQGTGENRQYVRLVQHEPMTDKELETAIQNRCSLTKGDVAAVLRELHDICVQEFTMGREFTSRSWVISPCRRVWRCLRNSLIER